MKYTSIERIWDKYENKYQALRIASLEARRVIDALQTGDIQINQNIYEHSLQALVAGEIRYEKLSEAEIDVLTREGYGDTSPNRPV